MSKTKNIIFTLITVVMSVAIICIVAEILFRLTKGAPVPLAEITQKKSTALLEPNSVLKNASEEFDVDARINSFGYRGKDFAKEKPKSVTRIFVVGDSFTFGVGSEDDQTIPALLEKYLKRKGYNVEVVNAGAGHTSPITHYINLRDIHLQYQPDIVLLLFDLTDLWDDWMWERSVVSDDAGEILRIDQRYKYGKIDWWWSLRRYSAFAKWIDRKIVRPISQIRLLGLKQYLEAKKSGMRLKAYISTSEDPNLADAKLEYDGLLMMRGQKEERLITDNFKRTAKYLSKIKTLVNQNNASLIIGMYPHGIYVGADQWSDGRRFWGFEPKQYTDLLPFELVKKFSQSNNIPYINTLDLFLDAEKRVYFFDRDGHLTPEGNVIVANGVASNPYLIGYLDALKGQ